MRACIVGFEVVGFDVAATVFGFEVCMGVIVLKWSFPVSQLTTALFLWDCAPPLVLSTSLCTYFQVLHGTYFVILHMVQKLRGGAMYSSPLLTKSQNKYKNRRTPTKWELIAQTENTVVRWEPYKNT